MVRKCIAPGCTTTARQGKLLFRFPRNEERKRQWIDVVLKAKPNCQIFATSCLCELHFPKSMWEKTRTDGSRKLRTTALPSFGVEVENTPPVSAKEVLPVQSDTIPESCPSSAVVTEVQILPSARSVILDHTYVPAVPRKKQHPQRHPLSITNKESHEGSPASGIREGIEERDSSLSQLAEVCNRADTLLATKDSADVKPGTLVETSGTTSGPAPQPVLPCPPNTVLLSLQIAELKKLVDKQQKEIKACKEDRDKVHKTASKVYKDYFNIKRKYDLSLRKIRKLETELETTKLIFKNRFQPDQIEALRRNSNHGLKWSAQTYETAHMLRESWGTQGYIDFLKLLPIFPSLRQLQKEVQGYRRPEDLT